MVIKPITSREPWGDLGSRATDSSARGSGGSCGSCARLAASTFSPGEPRGGWRKSAMTGPYPLVKTHITMEHIGKSQFSMGQSINMAIFNSYVSLPEGSWPISIERLDTPGILPSKMWFRSETFCQQTVAARESPTNGQFNDVYWTNQLQGGYANCSNWSCWYILIAGNLSYANINGEII